MQIFKQIAPLQAYLSEQKKQQKLVGLVPTMGALHEGHISLFRACKIANQTSVVSIFVNPIQFNNENDLLKYPRTLEKDIVMLNDAGCDVLFVPDTQEMYPTKHAVSFEFGLLDKVLEGVFRPGHFSGVALVVCKLFNIVKPDRAYFGQKDWQQFAVVRRLAEDLNFNIELHAVKTLRDTDGLALSSRNLRLNNGQREKANIFYKCLSLAKKQLTEGNKIEEVKRMISQEVNRVPDVKLEYFELVDSKNLIALNSVQESDNPILCIAGYVGDIRLIDNMFLHEGRAGLTG